MTCWPGFDSVRAVGVRAVGLVAGVTGLFEVMHRAPELNARWRPSRGDPLHGQPPMSSPRTSAHWQAPPGVGPGTVVPAIGPTGVGRRSTGGATCSVMPARAVMSVVAILRRRSSITTAAAVAARSPLRRWRGLGGARRAHRPAPTPPTSRRRSWPPSHPTSRRRRDGDVAACRIWSDASAVVRTIVAET